MNFKFLKYNIGIIIVAVFMACMSYKEFTVPRYGRENVPGIYLLISVILTLLLILIYYKYFQEKPFKIKKAGSNMKRGAKK